MSIRVDLNEIGQWGRQLGLLPVPLYAESSAEQRDSFVLVNGSRGNFCLSINNVEVEKDPRSLAWSANVGHFVSIRGNRVEVRRWHPARPDKDVYTSQSVQENLSKFHEFLERDAPAQDFSIISHSIRVFRRLRAALGSKYDGAQGLQAFLCLLACATDKVDRDLLSVDNWQLNPNALPIAQEISSEDWAALGRELVSGRVAENLDAELRLLLRHASGQLFQEAHYEAVFDPGHQPVLPNLDVAPAPVNLIPDVRKIGLHFTPPALARTLVEQALGRLRQGMIVFDPACGSGEFLRETVRQIELQGVDISARVIGWDISQAACDMAQFVLAWEKRNTNTSVDFEIQCLDALDPGVTWPTMVDRVFMNPPFVSWQDLSSIQKQSLKENLGELQVNRPDLSHAFLYKAAASLADTGTLGTILPASFLDGESAQRLRGWLSGVLSPRLIARLGSQFLFPKAMVDAALYIGGRGNPTADSVVFWADHLTSSAAAGLRALRKIRSSDLPGGFPHVGDGFSIYQDSSIGRNGDSWAPRPYRAWRLLRQIQELGLPVVSTVFDVQQGIRTGYNPSFLLKKDQRNKLPKAEQAYFKPAIVNDSIRDGVLTDTTYVFYPYGEMTLNSEQELIDRLPTYWRAYLSRAQTQLRSRAGVNDRNWWELTRPRALRIASESKLASTYFGDSGSFAWDNSGRFVVVQGYAWLPKRNRVLQDDAACAYLAILNSHFFSELLSASANNVAGGQWNLSTKFVAGIPLPNLMDDRTHNGTIQGLATLGGQIHNDRAIDNDLRESLVRQSYGLSEVL